MPLQIGDVGAGSGLTKAIYDQLDTLLSPPLQNDATTLASARDGWRKLAFAIATGVVQHVLAHQQRRHPTRVQVLLEARVVPAEQMVRGRHIEHDRTHAHADDRCIHL